MTARALPAFVLTPLLIVAIVVSSSACGTLANMTGGGTFSGRPVTTYPIPYGGAASDVNWAIKKPSAIPILAIDFCLSIVADTFTLPWVVLADIREVADWVSPPEEPQD